MEANQDLGSKMIELDNLKNELDGLYDQLDYVSNQIATVEDTLVKTKVYIDYTFEIDNNASLVWRRNPIAKRKNGWRLFLVDIEAGLDIPMRQTKTDVKLKYAARINDFLVGFSHHVRSIKESIKTNIEAIKDSADLIREV